jgi:cell division protein FtsW (lipid II flippase)
MRAPEISNHLRECCRRLALARNWPLLAAVGVLAGIGLLTIAATQPEKAANQIAFLAVALFCMAVFQTVNYARLGRWSAPFYLVSISLIALTLVGSKMGLPIVPRINGAANWIRVGPGSIQPAELMKVSFIMLLARYLRFRENYRRLKGLIPPLLLALLPMAMILKQPDLGTALVFIPTTIAMLFVAGAKLKHFAAFAGAGLILAPMLWLCGQAGVPVLEHAPSLVKKYQRDRVYAMFKDDAQTLKATGYQQHYGLAAFGSGGISGKGAGNVPVGRRVPESHNDMIFTLIGEQFGFVGSFVVITAYVVLFIAALGMAVNTKDPFDRLTAVGVTAALAGQTFLNLAVAMKVMPVTGVTLPFISAGGSSLIASFMAVGLLLNIGQHRPYLLSKEAFEFGESD